MTKTNETKTTAPTAKGRFFCAHCKKDITAPGAFGGSAPDAGGSCPTCKDHLCRRCAGGWCS